MLTLLQLRLVVLPLLPLLGRGWALLALAAAVQDAAVLVLLQVRLAVVPLLRLLAQGRALLLHAVDAVLTLLQLNLGVLRQLFLLGLLPAVQDSRLLLGLVPCLTA